MLVLSARINEQILIDEDPICRDNVLSQFAAVVKVLGYEHGKVKLGFAADKNVRILQEKVYQKKVNQWLDDEIEKASKK